MEGSGGLARVHAPAPLETAVRPQRLRRDRLVELLAREPFLILLVVLQAFILSVRLPDRLQSDTWLTLVAGRLVANDGLPHHETLTVWSHGRRWIDQQWLGQLLMYWLHAVGGIRTLLLVHVAFLTASFALALVFARRSGASSRSVALVGIVALLVSVTNSVARTQSFAFLLFVGLFWLLAAETRRPTRGVFLALPLLVVWANIHGSVILGVGLVLLWAFAKIVRIGRRRDAWTERGRAIALGLAAPLCLFVSPYGLSVVDYYRSVLGSGAFRDLVTEWQATTFPTQWPFFLLGVGGLWLLARKPARLSLFEHLAFVCMFFVALDAVRNLVWLALVAAMVVPRALDDVWPVGDPPLRRRVNIALSLGALAVLAGTLVLSAAHSARWYIPRFPERATAAVADATAQDRSVRIFANEAYADWLLWKVPSLSGRVAFDSRFELMSSKELLEVARFRARGSTNRLAPAVGYRMLVLDPRAEKPAIRAVLAQPGARALFRNPNVAVLLRSSAR
jgi:hypothetical protein